MMRLCDLEDGMHLLGDSGAPLSPPDDFDMEKFNGGRRFFRNHIFSCVIAMFFSLIIGMSVPELRKALIFTGESSTPSKALKRYIKTFQHIALWHYENVWDESSEAHKSIRFVRNLHKNVSIKMGEQIKSDSGMKVYMSQYDMGIVQSGFMGVIALYHDYFGVKCSPQDIDDYVYFWYGIGHLLGIENKYNICAHGKSQAILFCKEIEDMVIKNLEQPSPEFKLMSNVAIQGFAGQRKYFTLLSFPIIHYLSMEAMSRKRTYLNVIDSIRYCLWKCIILCIKCVPSFKNLTRKNIERVYNLSFV